MGLFDLTLHCSLAMAEGVVPYLFFSLCSLCWSMCILQILGLHRFNRVWARELPIIDKRYPQFVVAEAVVVCVNLAVFLPALISPVYGYPDIAGEWWGHLCIGLYLPNFLIVGCIEVCRIWLISYDLQYLNSSRHQQWKTEIDASYAEKDWYLRNKGKWGNRQYIVRLGFVFYIIPTTLALLAHFIGIVTGVDSVFGLGMIPLGIALMILTIIPLYLYMRTPRNLQDQCLFQYEFKWSAIVFTVVIFCWIVSVVVRYLVNAHVGITFMSCISVICYVIPSFLSTLVIPYKVNAMSEWNGRAKTLRIEIKGTSDSFNQKLREILNDEKNCEAFVDWMYREFCSEAMLSFLECVQFRKYVEKEIGKTDECDTVGGGDDSFNHELYDGMPKSSIVYDPFSFNKGGNDEVNLSEHMESGSSPTDNVLMRCKKIAHLLFKKYIDIYAPHEINISSRLRAKYCDLEERNYDGLDLKQFVTLYDDVITEMMKYQAQSHKRYENSLNRTPH